MADGRHFGKIEKSPHLSNGFTDCHETWYALWPSWPFRLLKFRNFKNPRWRRSPFLTKWQLAIYQQQFSTVMHVDPLDRADRQNFEILKIKMVVAAILKKNWKIASWTDRHHPTLSILPNKTANIIKQNWKQFLLVVKAATLKQQIPTLNVAVWHNGNALVLINEVNLCWVQLLGWVTVSGFDSRGRHYISVRN